MPPRKNCRKTNKVSGSILYNILDTYRRHKAHNNVRKMVYGGIKKLFDKGPEIDTNKNREVIEKMKYQLKVNKVNKNNKIFNDISELKKALNGIDFSYKNGVSIDEDVYTQRAKKLYKKVKIKFDKLVN